jgi:hypothetical protein
MMISTPHGAFPIVLQGSCGLSSGLDAAVLK